MSTSNSSTRYLITLVAVGALLWGVAFVFAAIGNVMCESRWSGYATDWRLRDGCMVEVEPGEWVPEDDAEQVHDARAAPTSGTYRRLIAAEASIR